MKRSIKILIALVIMVISLMVNSQDIKSLRNKYSRTEFKYDDIKGIGHQTGGLPKKCLKGNNFMDCTPTWSFIRAMRIMPSRGGFNFFPPICIGFF